MVALVKDDKKLEEGKAATEQLVLPPLVATQAVDDQKQAEAAKKRMLADGQRLRPEALEAPDYIGEQDTYEASFILPWDLEQENPLRYTHYQIKLLIFSHWLTEAKGQLATTKSCICKGIDTFERLWLAPRDERTRHLQEVSGKLSQQLDSVRVEIGEVLSDFCQFSSGYRVAGEIGVASNRAERPESDAMHSSAQHSWQEAIKDAISLQGAIYHAIPYIERMKQYYEDDLRAFSDKGLVQQQAAEQEYLKRVTNVYDALNQLMASLGYFARGVTETGS